jgi:lactoylglutathione lyase
MIRVFDLERALEFFRQLELVEVRRRDSLKGRFTLVFLAHAPGEPELELTHNWDETEPYSVGRHFGHLAYEVDDIYALCSKLADAGVVIHRPPHDGRMAFVRSPDGISIELLQRGAALAPSEPWISMPNVGSW